MTKQISDICVFDGRKWCVEDSDDLYHCVPNNDQLGLKTITPSTANWSGRIDHYLVHKRYLYLFKAEVSLPDDQLNLVPPGARRELRRLYEPIEIHGDQGLKKGERIHERRFFIYDDLKLDYTGDLILSYPTGDIWEYPWPLEEDDIAPCIEATLTFHRGKLEYYEERLLSDDN